MTARIDPELAKQLAGDPDLQVEAIITCKGGLDAALADLPDDVEVRHTYRRINGAAVCGPAGAMIRLAEVRGVTSMEPVRTVST